MKRSALLFLGAVLSLLVSCTPSKNDMLMKTWMMDDKKAEILFRFDEGGKFFLQSENFDGTASTNNGKWKFADAKEMVIIELNGQEKVFQIEKLTDKKLILLPRGEKLKLSFSAKPDEE